MTIDPTRRPARSLAVVLSLSAASVMWAGCQGSTPQTIGIGQTADATISARQPNGLQNSTRSLGLRWRPISSSASRFVADRGHRKPPKSPAPTTVPTTAPTTTVPATTVPATTVPATTVPATTAPPTTVPATTVPATTVPATTAPPAADFPTAETAGVPTGATLVPWTGAWRSSQATGMPTRVVNGVTYKLFRGYVFDSGTSGNYFYVDDPNVIFENVRFVTSGQVSNTSAMLQQGSSNVRLVVQYSDFDGGPYHQRGIQADYGVSVFFSEFTRFGNAAIEMNNRNGTGSLDAENNYLYEPKGWAPADHTDGIQVGGGNNVTIRNNTVLIQPYGGTDGDTSYVSNSALGLWAELGNVTGTVLVQHNKIAGGGRVMYLEQKSPYTWQGPVTVTDNVFDQCYSTNGGVWGPLYPYRLPANLTWTNNTWSSGAALTLQQALTLYP